MQIRKIFLTALMALALIGLTWAATAAASYDEPVNTESTVALQGVIEEIGADSLVVAGLTVTVSETTQIEEDDEPLELADLEVGWTVQVEGPVLADGAIAATEIQVVSREPVADETPIELLGVIETIGADSLVVAGLTVTADDTTEIKKGDEPLGLADLEVGWTVKVEGFLLADGTVVASEIKVISDEPVTPTPTTTLTPTITLTPTLTPTPTVTVTPTPEGPHPVGLALADFFGVPYDEIMAWHEQGIGFGNIATAYFLANALEDEGLTVEHILDEKLSGTGWGQVMKAAGLKPGHKDKNLGQVISGHGDDDDEPEETIAETDDRPGKGHGRSDKDKEKDKKDKDKGKGKP